MRKLKENFYSWIQDVFKIPFVEWNITLQTKQLSKSGWWRWNKNKNKRWCWIGQLIEILVPPNRVEHATPSSSVWQNNHWTILSPNSSLSIGPYCLLPYTSWLIDYPFQHLLLQIYQHKHKFMFFEYFVTDCPLLYLCLINSRD